MVVIKWFDTLWVNGEREMVAENGFIEEVKFYKRYNQVKSLEDLVPWDARPDLVRGGCSLDDCSQANGPLPRHLRREPSRCNSQAVLRRGQSTAATGAHLSAARGEKGAAGKRGDPHGIARLDSAHHQARSVLTGYRICRLGRHSWKS